MKKWSEIKQAALDKLFLSIEEADDQGYLAKFRYLANECLNIIANGVKPRIKVFNFGVFNRVVEGTDFKYDSELGLIIFNQNGISAEIVPDNTSAYVDGKLIYYFDNGLKRTDCDKAVTLDSIITMPDDFLSFADMIVYHNNTPYDEVVYLSDRDFVVGEIGRYFIYYNAAWDDITEDDVRNDSVLTTDISVLNCLPTYIASQCLSQDDVQRSAILKNDFELMLSRLDTNILYQENHFRSSGGWY